MRKIFTLYLFLSLIITSVYAQTDALNLQSTGLLIDYQSNGNNAIDPSAMLQLNQDNTATKGFLVPRVTITSDVTGTPATGLLVYQTGAPAGFYYYTGTAWVLIANTTSGAPPTGAAGGDLTGTYPNPTIIADAVTTSKILDNTITTNDVLNGTLLTADLANDAVTNAKLNNMAVNTIKGRITAGTGDPEDLTAAQVRTIIGLAGTQYGATYWATTSTLGTTAVGATNTVLHGNTGAAPSYSAIVSADITDGTITSADILNGTIASVDITDNSIATGDILNGTVASVDITDNSISSTDILNGTVASVDITDNSISSTDILNGTIATADIANNAIDGTKLGIGTTNGDILYYNGTDWARLGAGTTGTVLRSNGVAAPSWVDLNGSGIGDNLGNHTATTNLDMVNNNINNVNILSGRATASYDKLRVWNSSSYTIGMINGLTVGYINNDYAMTFTMSATATRGFLWRDASDAVTDGAMSLTTDGRLWVKSTAHFNGNVGIGTNNPTYNLQVIGRIKSNAINETSDLRLKTDISPLSNSLEKVLNMQGVNYKWRTDEFPEMKFDEGLQFGLIAQELEKIVPELVSTDSEGWKSIEYSHIVPLLIEAIKEQQTEIDKLTESNKRISDMEDTLNKLKALIPTHEIDKTAGN